MALRAGQVVAHAGELAGVGLEGAPQALVDAGGEAVDAGEHEVDVDPVGVLLGLDLPGQLGRGRLRIRDLADDLRVGLHVFVDHALGELQVAGDVEDVEAHRGARRVGDGAGALGSATGGLVRRTAGGDEREGGEQDRGAAGEGHDGFPSLGGRCGSGAVADHQV
jgi:hypothetical protein